MKRIAALLAIFLANYSIAFAETVNWASAQLFYYGNGADWGYDKSLEIYDCCWLSNWAFPDVFYGTSGDGNLKFISSNNDATTFGLLNEGTIIDASSLQGCSILDVVVPLTDDGIYVAFSYVGMYGWVQFIEDQDGVLTAHGAVDLDGGAMIVGGGAVPEPTSTLLLLVGVSGLALRRKRRMSICVGSEQPCNRMSPDSDIIHA